ncbi:hypothetical protein HNP00_001833 [Arthrobacter sp. AZCC_0090]|nr:hypothetical protein [Arthrobacter sp. AZCC_0090]
MSAAVPLPAFPRTDGPTLTARGRTAALNGQSEIDAGAASSVALVAAQLASSFRRSSLADPGSAVYANIVHPGLAGHPL